MHDLAAHINQPLYAAHGIMEMLWHHAGDYSPDGDIGKLKDSAIARAVDWKGDSSLLIEALVDSRWLDRHERYRLLVHDWPDHAQEWVKKKLTRIQKVKRIEDIRWLQVYDKPQNEFPATVQPPSSHRPAISSLTDESYGKIDLSGQCPDGVASSPRAGGFSLAKGGKGSSSSQGTHTPENGTNGYGSFEIKPLADKLWQLHPSPSQFGSVEQALDKEIRTYPETKPEVFAATITASMEAWTAYWLTEKRHATGIVKWITDGDYARQPPVKKRAPQTDAPETAAQVLEREARQSEADDAARVKQRAVKAAPKENA